MLPYFQMDLYHFDKAFTDKTMQDCMDVQKQPTEVLSGSETLAQVFSSEFCEISKNTSSTEHLQTTASGCYFKNITGWQ